VNCTLKVFLGTFVHSGIEANIGPDVPAGIQTALSEYVRRVESGVRPIGLPRFPREAPGASSAVCFDLPVDEHTLAVLEREAARQRASVSEIAAHSVLLYLADLDRLTPPGSSWAA
jgi:hypothetical protein